VKPFNRSTDVGWGLHSDISSQFSEETEPRVGVDHCLRRFRSLKGPSHFSLLAQRKVTQRNGLKGSRHERDTSLNLSIDAESLSPRVTRLGCPARRRSAEDLKRACLPLRAALSPQRYGASRYRGRMEAGEPTLIAVPQTFRLVTCIAPRALQAISLGYFSLGQQRKVTRSPTAIESAAGNGPRPRAPNFLRGTIFSNYKNVGIRQGANPINGALIDTAMLEFAPQPTEAGACVV